MLAGLFCDMMDLMTDRRTGGGRIPYPLLWEILLTWNGLDAKWCYSLMLELN